MLRAILGKKLGMTQVPDDEGRVVPVTVLQAGPCQVIQARTAQRDGYDALQIGFEDVSEKNVSKPLLGIFEKAGIAPKRVVGEIPSDGEEHEPGEAVTVEIFNDVHFVDVVGATKGKGFAGVMRRWGFSGHDATHGAVRRRVHGSIGQAATPSRVFKGKKMAGRMGGRRVMAKSLEVVRVDPERNVLLVKGSVPGRNGGYVQIRRSAAAVAAGKKRRH